MAAHDGIGQIGDRPGDGVDTAGIAAAIQLPAKPRTRCSSGAFLAARASRNAASGSPSSRSPGRIVNSSRASSLGFVLSEARPGERFALKGRHLFAVYRWVFEVEPDGPGQTRVRSATWAAFPGMHGQVYRALVIGTGTHRVVVRRILRRIARRAQVDADYVDVLEVPISPDDARTAEQAFHDALGHARVDSDVSRRGSTSTSCGSG
ncbi:hypothetical protein I552_7283 [Mycobacterium xenopi 3993]|nr:hypothetical protein I552_7283 [Mycobacterium xenopi 3993]